MTKPLRKRRTEPLWKGPCEDGVTFSLLSKFLFCKERFRLRVVEGIKEDKGFVFAIEYGSMWHEAEEAHAAGGDWRKAISSYLAKCRATHPAAESDIVKTYSIVKHVFPVYVNHYAREEANRTSIFQEETFHIPYKLPSGRVVFLRGKFDQVFAITRSTYVQENKTKGERMIDQQGMQATIDRDLQSMIYQTALRHPEVRRLLPPKSRITGICYNVMQRPLSSRHSPRQRKGRMVNHPKIKGKKIRKGAETEQQFYKRVAEEIKAKPREHFHRWRIPVTNNKLAEFQRITLDPLLEHLCDWWEWLQQDPFNPWDIKGQGVHYQFPWGVYNPIADGLRGDYFEYLALGNRHTLKHIDTLFPEL